MARNAAASYGRDIRCVRDADPLFRDAVGLDVLEQDLVHRLTTDDVLGDDGTGSFMIAGWGFNVARLLGVPRARLAMHQPILAEVLTRDPRVLHADVTLAPIVTNGLADVRIEAVCATRLGPFVLIKSVQQLTGADLVGQS